MRSNGQNGAERPFGIICACGLGSCGDVNLAIERRFRPIYREYMVQHHRGNLLDEHTPHAIATRLEAATTHSYLGDFVLGAVDGAVTTFAIVCGVAGANLSGSVAIVLGVANLLADGLSMATSNYLKARADREVVEHFRAVEERHIDEIPAGEREEIRQIFAGKGFQGDILEEVVKVITRDRRQWVDTMLTEEWGLQLETPQPFRSGLVTFIAFFIAGSVPLVPLIALRSLPQNQIYLVSAAATALVFVLTGVFRGKIVGQPMIRSGLETLFVGGIAAAMAFVTGAWLRGLIE